MMSHGFGKRQMDEGHKILIPIFYRKKASSIKGSIPILLIKPKISVE